MARRVVITGIGTVAPGDPGVDAFWELISSGTTATRRITLFDPERYRSQIAAECNFSGTANGLSSREVRRLDRATQFALVSTREAIANSGIDLGSLAPDRLGVAFGSAVGCTTAMEREYAVLSDDGRDWLVDAKYAVAALYDHFVPSSIAAELARDIRAEGPVALISDGCTSGLDAIGYASELIREGTVDVVVSGGTDAPISPITLACFDAIKATSPRNDAPETASRPFDSSRNGLVLGEGSASLVLEELEHARARNAPILAEVAGFGSRSNAFHMTGLRPDGTEMAYAIDEALGEARIAASELHYINAHGSSTKQNDRHETAAFKRSLGRWAYETPVSSIKSMIGHSLGAIGALEIAACALAMQHDVIPPTANLYDADPECDLDYVPREARETTVDTVLSVGSGFGGFQSAIVLARPDRRIR